MLKHRLIACLLWDNGVMVQSMRFKHQNAMGSAYIAVDFFNEWAVDEIILLNASGDNAEEDYFLSQLVELSSRCFIPLSVGGWITSIEQIRRILLAGADKVVINTIAVRTPEFIKQASAIFGNQCIIVSIDVKKNEKGENEIYIDRGRERTGFNPVDFAKQAEKLGAGEIFLTSIDQDGQQQGYDLNLIRSVADAVKIPVIASGGVGEWQHFADAIKIGHADAVSAANIFYYVDQSTKVAKDYMKDAGIEVRRPEFYRLNTPRNPKYRI